MSSVQECHLLVCVSAMILSSISTLPTIFTAAGADERCINCLAWRILCGWRECLQWHNTLFLSHPITQISASDKK